jgi:hypothetical protein
MKRLLIASAMAVALTGTSDAQGVSIGDLRAAATSLALAVSRVPDGLRTARLTTAAEWLRNNARRANAENVSPEYVRSLDRASSLLTGSLNPDAIEDVTRELEAKVTHCRSLGIGMGGSVLVKVNTRRGDRVVSDWQVLYLLKFDEWLKTPPRNFLRVSSPAEMAIEPGRYWVWAHDPVTKQTSARVLVEVSGRKELTLDLPVP